MKSYTVWIYKWGKYIEKAICEKCRGLKRTTSCNMCGDTGEVEIPNVGLDRCPCQAVDTHIDNVLIRQKDYIFQLINSSRYKEARCCLTALCELWTINEYKYKYDELIRILNDRRTRQPED
jgi:hypothetical protein